MAFLQGVVTTHASSIHGPVTVPAGVTSSQYLMLAVILATSVANETPPTITPGDGAVTFTTLIPPTVVFGMHIAVFKATGVTASDTITVELQTGMARIGGSAQLYFDTDFDVISSIGTIAGTSGQDVVAPALTVSAGQKVYAVGLERSATTGSLTGLTFTNSNGDTVTTDYATETTTQGTGSWVLGHFTEPTTSTGTTDIHYNVATTSAAAFHIAELVSSVAATGSATVTFSGVGAASVPGPTGAATLTFAGTSAAAATAAPSATLTFTGSGSAGVPVLTSAMSAAVGTTTAKVRIDATNTTSATVTAATNTGLTTGVVTSGSVTLDGDGLGIATLTGLTAGTNYFYGVSLNGTLQAARGNFRTAQSGAHSFSFAAASCVNTTADPAVLDSIRTRTGPTGRTAEFFAHLGDLEYKNDNTSSATTYLTDYRAVVAKTKHAALFSALPVEYTWSDHDCWGDNCDISTAGVGTIAAIRSAWSRYFPTFDLPGANTDSAPWRSWVRGRVRFVMTDGRSYMTDKNGTDNSSKTKLGTAQKAWWKSECAAATAAGQAIVWFHEDGGWTATGTFTNDDTWAAYQTERAELVTYLTGIGALNRIMLIHGDFHALAADDGTHSAGAIPVACASPMQMTYYMPTQDHWSAGPYPATDPGTTMNQYGWFDVTDTGGTSLTVAFTGFSNDGTSDTSRITLTATLATSTPASASATLTFSGTGATATPAPAAATLTFAGTGSAKAPTTAAATVTFGGTASAVAPSAASATVTYSGTGAAQAPAASAATVTFAGAAGATVPAAASATVTWVGASSASAPAAAAGTLTFAGTGAAAPPGGASAVITYTGTSSGQATAVAAATVTWSGTGTVIPAGQATGAATITWSGAAAAASRATAAATLTYTGTGAAAGAGVATGNATLTYTAAASPAARTTGSATITFTAGGSAYNPSAARNITLTVTTGPRRWTATAGTLEGML